jgi:hypothetical protein
MRTYQKHAMPSMMLTLPRLSLPLPCQALGREKTFLPFYGNLLAKH